MRVEASSPFNERRVETLGHQVEYKVGDFILGSFDCVEKIERTAHNGQNDKKGIDFVITFEDGSKMAVDVTANKADNEKVRAKQASILRMPMGKITQEFDADGNIVVEKTDKLVPKALIKVDMETWEDCYVENTGSEVIVGMSDDVRIKQEMDILSQLLQQIKMLSGLDSHYEQATQEINQILQAAKEELDDIKKQAA